MKSVILRLKERRQSNLLSLHRYLSNLVCLSDIEEHEIFNMPSKSVLQKTAKNLLFRAFPTNPDDLEFTQEVDGLENLDENLFSLEDKLRKKFSFWPKTAPQFKQQIQGHFKRNVGLLS